MLKGKSLTEMAKELERIAEERVDHIVATESIEAKANDGKVTLNFEDADSKEVSVDLNSHAGGQVAGFTDIPTRYFRKLEAENASLLADNINHGLKKKARTDKGRMVRTLDGQARGFLSSSQSSWKTKCRWYPLRSLNVESS